MMTTAIPKSPFFSPSNRNYESKSPHGTRREVLLEDVETKSTILGAYANLVNVMIGAGIVGLVSGYYLYTCTINCMYLLIITSDLPVAYKYRKPYAIKESGLIAGTIMIILIAFMTGER